MAWIVIECFPDIKNAMIVVDGITGENKMFDTEEEAEEEAADCQDGLVVEIN